MKKLIYSLLLSAATLSAFAAEVPEKIYVLGSNVDVNGMKTGWDPYNPVGVDVVDGEATLVITCAKDIQLNVYTATPEQIAEAAKRDYVWGLINETGVHPNSLDIDMFGVEQGLNHDGYLNIPYGGKWTLHYTQGVTKVIVNCEPDNDVANFARYHEDNKRIMAETNDGTRVVFMGNSITDNWPQLRRSFFTDNNFIGRGIGGQCSYEMLLRFREDVVRLKPAAVVISAGTNDIAGNFCNFVEERTIGNIKSMAEIAHANGIKVLLASVLPVTSYGWAPHVKDHKDKIEALNALIKAYADEHGYTYIDYYSQLVTSDRTLNPAYTEDGVHPTAPGYEIMERIVLPLVRKAVEDAGVKGVPAAKADARLVSVDGFSVQALSAVNVYDEGGKLVATMAEGESKMLGHGFYVATGADGSCRFAVGVH